MQPDYISKLQRDLNVLSQKKDVEKKCEEQLRQQIWERIGDEGSNLTDRQKHQLLDLLMKYKNLFDPNRHVEFYRMEDVEAELGLERSKEVAQELVDEAKAAIAEFGDRAAPLNGLADYIIMRKN